MWGGLRAAKPGCEGAFLCGMVRGVVEFLMGGVFGPSKYGLRPRVT